MTIKTALDYQWYVLQILSGKEYEIKDYIYNKFPDYGFNIKIIKRKKIERIKGNLIEVKRILFPGYLFILIPNDKFNPVLLENIELLKYKKEGIIRFLRDKHTNKPCPIKKNEILFLNALLNKENEVDYTIGMKIGDEIKIVEGAFKEQTAKIIKIDMRKFVIKVNFTFMGEQTIDLPFTWVEQIDF